MGSRLPLFVPVCSECLFPRPLSNGVVLSNYKYSKAQEKNQYYTRRWGPKLPSKSPLGLLCIRVTVTASGEALILFILVLWKTLLLLSPSVSSFSILLPLKQQQGLPLTVYRGQCSRTPLSAGTQKGSTLKCQEPLHGRMNVQSGPGCQTPHRLCFSQQSSEEVLSAGS